MWAFPNALDYWILRFAVSFVYGIDIFMHLKRIWRHTLPSNTQVRWTTWQVATLMMRMLCSQYPLATFSHDKLGIWSGLFGRKLFSVIFASFFFVFFFAWINRRIFSMEATPDARSLQDRALIGTSGGVRWLSSEKPLVARTPWTPQPSWSVRCQWTQDVFILDISQNPPNFLHTVRRLGEEWMHLHQMIRLIEGHALKEMLLIDVDDILPGVFAGWNGLQSCVWHGPHTGCNSWPACWPLLFENVVPLLMKQRLQVLPFSPRRDLNERNMYKVLLFLLDSWWWSNFTAACLFVL